MIITTKDKESKWLEVDLNDKPTVYPYAVDPLSDWVACRIYQYDQQGKTIGYSNKRFNGKISVFVKDTAPEKTKSYWAEHHIYPRQHEADV